MEMVHFEEEYCDYLKSCAECDEWRDFDDVEFVGYGYSLL